MQPEKSLAFLRACKAAGVSTAVETCLNVPWEILEQALPEIDLLMFDLKLMDDAEHIRLTGASNRLILENIGHLSQTRVPLVARTPVIPGATDSPENIAAIAEFLRGGPKPPVL